MNKLWDKGISVNKEIEVFTVGKDRELDILMAGYDVLGCIAHAKMLESIGILDNTEEGDLVKELRSLYSIIEKGEFKIETGVEDVHSQVEKMLTEALGDSGKKVHTGRSRNDQVALDIHLFIRDQINKTVLGTVDLFNALMMLATEYSEVFIPGYTHFQVAMPASFGLWFSSFAEDLCDDITGFHAAWKTANQNPLGAGAGFGTSIALNREMTTRLLGFETLRYNSMHAMMSRGRLEKVTAQSLSNLAGTLSRLAMDVTLYMGQNHNFLSFPEEYTTGSSIMPHKKNPDVFELIRAKCNKIKAIAYEIDLVIGNLPSGYHRDYQVLKETLFPAFEEIQTCMHLSEKVLLQIQVRKDILQEQAYKYIGSVDKVNKMVSEGTPFRDAYQAVAQQIRNKTYSSEPDYKHTHEGSIGNLCLDKINDKMKDRISGFDFERVNRTLENLLEDK